MERAKHTWKEKERDETHEGEWKEQKHKKSELTLTCWSGMKHLEESVMSIGTQADEWNDLI